MKQKVRKGFKRCSTCGRIIKADLKNFYRDSCHIDGLSNNCKVCQRGYTDNYYEDHKEYYSKYKSLKCKWKNNKIPFSIFVGNVSELKDRYGIGSNSRSFI